jgi:hypothetical protein
LFFAEVMDDLYAHLRASHTSGVQNIPLNLGQHIAYTKNHELRLNRHGGYFILPIFTSPPTGGLLQQTPY